MPFAASRAFGPSVPLSGRLRSELGGARRALRATAQRSGSAMIIFAVGEVDASNELAWKHLLSEVTARASAPGTIIVDVRELSFIGCCGFAALAAELQRCRRRGISLRLVSQQPIVARIAAACGLRRLLPIHPTIESALSQASAAANGGRT